MSDPKSDADTTQRTVPPPPMALSPEEAILEGRRERGAAVRARGESPFPNQVGALDTVGSVIRLYEAARLPDGKYDPEKVAAVPWASSEGPRVPSGEGPRVAGRIVAMRSFGKAAF